MNGRKSGCQKSTNEGAFPTYMIVVREAAGHHVGVQCASGAGSGTFAVAAHYPVNSGKAYAVEREKVRPARW